MFWSLILRSGFQIRCEIQSIKYCQSKTGIIKQIVYIPNLFISNNFFPNKMNTFSPTGQTEILFFVRPRGIRLQKDEGVPRYNIAVMFEVFQGP